MPNMAELERMKEAASRQAREMRARAVGNATAAPSPESGGITPAETPPSPPLDRGHREESLLDAFFRDHERTLILALLLLLGEEEDRAELLFALMYLLL